MIFLFLFLGNFSMGVQTYSHHCNLDFSVHALWGGDHRPPLYDWQTQTVWPKNIKIETTAETKTS